VFICQRFRGAAPNRIAHDTSTEEQIHAFLRAQPNARLLRPFSSRIEASSRVFAILLNWAFR
jgi:hypothetical protein